MLMSLIEEDCSAVKGLSLKGQTKSMVNKKEEVRINSYESLAKIMVHSRSQCSIGLPLTSLISNIYILRTGYIDITVFQYLLADHLLNHDINIGIVGELLRGERCSIFEIISPSFEERHRWTLIAYAAGNLN